MNEFYSREKIMHGEQLLLNGKIEEALNIFESVLEKEPNNTAALNNKGVLLNHLKKYQDAIQIFQEVLRKDQKHPNAAFNLIANYLSIGNWKEAENTLTIYRHTLPQTDIEMISRKLNEIKSPENDFVHDDTEKILTLTVKSNSSSHTLRIYLDFTKFSQKIMWNCLSKGQFYEQGTSNFLASALREGDSFIDIGSHIGYFSLLASIIVGNSGQVFAIEPEASNFAQLTTNISLNKFSNIKTFSLVLGSKIEQKQFFINKDNDGGHALWNVGLHPFNKNSRANPVVKDINTATLDSLFEGNNPNSLKLIKMDVEGSEYAILQGGTNMISRHNVPYIICEINRFALQQMGTSEKELRRYMELLGYETYLLNDETPYFTRLSKDDYIETNYVFNVIFSKAGNPND